MQAADHEPVFVKPATPLIVQGTHHIGPKALGHENPAVSDVRFGSVDILALVFIATRSHALPNIRPLYIGMMAEIACAAIVSTHRAGQADLARHMVVGLLHLSIKLRQLLKQRAS